jgi:hypothetical protein
MLTSLFLCAGLHDFQPVAVLMHASAELLTQMPAVGPQHCKHQRLAYLIAAAAALGESLCKLRDPLPRRLSLKQSVAI